MTGRIYDKSELEGLKQSLIKTINTINTNNIKHGIELNVNDSDKICMFTDVHSDIETLQNGWRKVIDMKSDYVIFLGDYVDKGPESLACVKFILDKFNNDSSHVIVLIGNHEESFCSRFCKDLIESIKLTSGFNNLIELYDYVMQLLPCGCYIRFKPSNKTIFCAHGAYPFMYKKRYIKVEDEFEQAWKELGLNIQNVKDVDELVYEDNTTYNLSPTDYINKIYDTMKNISSIVVKSPKVIHVYKDVVKALNDLMSTNNETKEKAKTALLGDLNKELQIFIIKWNEYKTYLGKYEHAKQDIINLKTYITWGDMFVVDNIYEKYGPLKSEDDLLNIREQNKTDFLHIRDRMDAEQVGLAYPVRQLEQWINKSNINAFIRGHQITINLFTVRDLKTNNESTPKGRISLNNDSKLYVCFHSTSLCAKLSPKGLLSDPKMICIHDNTLEGISINT